MNSMYRVCLPFAVAACIGAAAVTAQEAERPLTLEECVAFALSNNAAMKAAEAGVSAARETVGEADALYYPRLTANAGYSRWQKLAFLPSGLTLPPTADDTVGPTDDWMAGLTAQWILYDRARGGMRTSAVAGSRAAACSERQVRQDVAMAVHQAFHECVAAGESRVVADRILSRAGDHLKMARDRVRAGATTQSDEMRAQVEVSNAKLGVLRAEARLRIAKGLLNTAMGLAAEQPVEVSRMNQPIAPPGELRISETMDEAMRKRPELQAAARAVDAAKGDLVKIRSEHGPRVLAQGTYDRRTADLAGPADEWIVGVSVELPLFSGFGTMHRAARAEAVLSQAEARARHQALIVRQEVWSVYSQWQENHQAVEATGSQVADAMESVRLMAERYRTGACTMNELLDAETALVRAESARIDAQRSCHVAAAAFKRAVGVLEP